MKLLRAVFMKGMTALLLETLEAAQRRGIRTAEFLYIRNLRPDRGDSQWREAARPDQGRRPLAPAQDRGQRPDHAHEISA